MGTTTTADLDGGGSLVTLSGNWMDRELAGCQLPDERLAKRLRQIFDQLGNAMGEAIPRACQDWANTKAAYRFFSNHRVDEDAILKGHFKATRDRFAATAGPVLVLQDTTEFTYQREKPELIGLTNSVNSGKDKEGRLRHHAICGLLMHSSLAVTVDGTPLGMTAVKFWDTRQVQGHGRTQAQDQPDAHPHRNEGKLPLA